MGFWWKNEDHINGLVELTSSMVQFSPRGAVDWTTTLQRARRLSENGVSSAIVTTTLEQHRKHPALVSQLQNSLRRHQISLKIRHAIEQQFETELFAKLTRASIASGPISRKYAFLRVPKGTFLPIAAVVESVQKMGLTTVLLSAENSARFRSSEQERQRIVQSGAFVHFSASSLFFDPADTEKSKFCKRMIRSGVCDLVSGDRECTFDHPSGELTETRHRFGSVSSPDLPKPKTLAQAYLLVKSWAGKKKADDSFRKVPQQIFSYSSERPVISSSVSA